MFTAVDEVMALTERYRVRHDLWIARHFHQHPLLILDAAGPSYGYYSAAGATETPWIL